MLDRRPHVLIPPSLTTPNGSLIAYTSPADVRELRDQAALILVTWREQFDLHKLESNESTATSKDHGGSVDQSASKSNMHTMIMEFESRNVLVRSLQPRLLLVLEGGVPPGRTRKLQITVEGPNGTKRLTDDETADQTHLQAKPSAANGGDGVEASRLASSPAGLSETSTTNSTRKQRTNILEIHRRKLDALAQAIQRDFQKSSFSMPLDPDDRFF